MTRKKDMKDGFTLIEVSILFIIFIIVAVLIVPLSVDDVILSKNIDKWRQAQLGFSVISISMTNSDNYKANKPLNIQDFMAAIVKAYPLKKVVKYKVKYLNGDYPAEDYCFPEMYLTNNGATIAFKWLDKNSVTEPDEILGRLMYDVNGKSGPNVWGKDIFGFDVYKNELVPFGATWEEFDIDTDCSRQGTGLACSFVYLKGVTK